MIFIDKTTEHSRKSKQRLEDWKKIFRHNGESLEDLYAKKGQKGQKGRPIWDFFGKEYPTENKRLRDDLRIEQSFICCYCGQRIGISDAEKMKKQPQIPTRIDHFLPIDDELEFPKRLFNYDNLLLSCTGDPETNLFIKIERSKGTLFPKDKFELAQRAGVTVQTIDEYNPNKKFEVGKQFYYQKDHCDPYKSNKKDSIVNPTEHPLCWKYFKFDYDGGIIFNDKIEDETIKTLVENSIRVLNLDAKRLKEKRLEALVFFTDELQTLIETFQDFDINAYFANQLHTKSPFCFVIYHFIQSYG